MGRFVARQALDGQLTRERGPGFLWCDDPEGIWPRFDRGGPENKAGGGVRIPRGAPSHYTSGHLRTLSR